MKKFIAWLALCSLISTAGATETKLEKIQVDTSMAAVERGIDNLMGNCHNCHTLKYVKYHDLLHFGISKSKVDAWRGDQPLDAPMTGLLPDTAAMQSFGKIPPDLSLMANAREGGPSYVYAYLLGYYTTAEGLPGNHIFPETKMPDALGISSATDEAQRAEIKSKARDIVSFLTWAADPHKAERHRLGYYVIGYLLVLTLMMYFVKKKIWSRLE